MSEKHHIRIEPEGLLGHANNERVREIFDHQLASFNEFVMARNQNKEAEYFFTVADLIWAMHNIHKAVVKTIADQVITSHGAVSVGEPSILYDSIAEYACGAFAKGLQQEREQLVSGGTVIITPGGTDDGDRTDS